MPEDKHICLMFSIYRNVQESSCKIINCEATTSGPLGMDWHMNIHIFLVKTCTVPSKVVNLQVRTLEVWQVFLWHA